MERKDSDLESALAGKSINSHMSDHYAQVTPRSYQFKALMRKNFKLQMRQRCTLVCQIAVPLILVLFVGAMQLVFDNLVQDQQKGYDYPSLKDFVRLDYFDSYFLGANPNNISELGYLNFDGSKAGFLGMVDQQQYTFANITYYTPFISLFDSRSKLMSELTVAKEKFNAELQSGKKSSNIPFPTLAFNFLDVALKDPGKALTLSMEVLKETQFPYTLFFEDNDPQKAFVSGISMFSKSVCPSRIEKHNNSFCPGARLPLQGGSSSNRYRQFACSPHISPCALLVVACLRLQHRPRKTRQIERNDKNDGS